MLNRLKKLVFPLRCPVCDRPGCSECLPKLLQLDNTRCPLCGGDRCRCRGLWCDGYTVLFAYETQNVKQSILRMKYANRASYSVSYAALGAQVLCERENLPFDLVAFVPFYKAEKKERDYNSSELIAGQLSKLLEVPMEAVLVKLRATRKQHELPLRERIKNLCGCFEADSSVKGKTILLCDDVITTGTTVDICAQALKIAGAERVYVFAVAAAGLNKRR